MSGSLLAMVSEYLDSDDAAVHAQRLSVDPVGRAADEKRHHRRNVFWLTETFERRHPGEAFDLLRRLVVEKELSCRRSWRNGVHSNIAAAQFLREDVRHRVHRGLRGGVDRVARHCERLNAAGEVDDAAAGAQLLRGHTQCVESALQVDRDKLVEQRIVSIGKRDESRLHHAGIVHNNVDATEQRDGLIKHRGDLGRDGNVGLNGSGSTTCRFDGVDYRLSVRGTARVVDNDGDTFSCEAFSDGGTDAARGSRDDGNFRNVGGAICAGLSIHGDAPFALGW
ncbi:hypothetical protein PSAC2689_170071 [Paraburkholderia sacchari]